LQVAALFLVPSGQVKPFLNHQHSHATRQLLFQISRAAPASKLFCAVPANHNAKQAAMLHHDYPLRRKIARAAPPSPETPLDFPSCDFL
jgi:hypothetical protein